MNKRMLKKYTSKKMRFRLLKPKSRRLRKKADIAVWSAWGKAYLQFIDDMLHVNCEDFKQRDKREFE